MLLDEEVILKIRKELLSWYERNRRDYPWRITEDPYKILIAEIMLQRTKSDQVASIYEDFIRRFPDPQSLHKADPEIIRAYFSKLGLLWRAELVKKLAASLVERFQGKVPSDREQLLSLPAVGEYIADAVLAFAYGKDVAVIDSNVCRVLQRLFGLEKRGEARRDKRFRELAQRLIPPGNARVFNWAMIDFASMLCTPQKPRCGECPLKSMCKFGRKGNELKSNP